MLVAAGALALPGAQSAGAELRLFEPGYGMSKQFVAVTVYKVLREHAPGTLSGCLSDVKSEPDRFGDLGAAGAFTRGAVSCLDKLGYLDGLPGGSARGGKRMFEPGYGMSKQFVAVTVYKVLREHAPGTLSGCLSDVKSEPDRFGDLGAAGAFTRGAVSCLDKLGYLDGLPGGYSALSAGTLPPGVCGGSVTNPPSRLVDDPASEDPAWSSDCTRIAYSRSGHIWTANLDGSGRKRITSGSGDYYQPAWAPGGDKIAYIQAEPYAGWSHIWTVNADGTGRTKLTHGDEMHDAHPDWSPDGNSIAFERNTQRSISSGDNSVTVTDRDRYVVVMDSDGRNETVLASGGSWESSPVWSPDGTEIAYVSDNRVGVMNRDGTEQRIVGGAVWNRGLSWSPDGRWIAFAKGSDASGVDIVALKVDGRGEFQITDVEGWPLDPKWSPDGQRIAFTHYSQTDSDNPWRVRYAAVVGAAGTPLPIASDCRPARSGAEVTTGFPLPDWVAPSTGRVRVAVLFVDFSDAQATYSTRDESEHELFAAERYLEAMSYGRLDVQYVPHHDWLRAPKSYRGYQREGEDMIRDAVSLVEDVIDFSGFHILTAVLPSSHFGGGIAGGTIDVGGVAIPKHIINIVPFPEPIESAVRGLAWRWAAAHELAHSLGLADLYPFRGGRERASVPDALEWVTAEFGLMGLKSHWLAARSAADRQPPGSTSSITYFKAPEMLAWSRWQLGWLDQSQVRCVDGPTTTVRLAPVARPDSSTAMVAVPLSSTEVIVVESRRALGYDYDLPPHYEGLLVYTVNSSIISGDLPVKVAGTNSEGQVGDYPLLSVGESVTVRGHTFTLTADDGDTHTVTIVRN